MKTSNLMQNPNSKTHSHFVDGIKAAIFQPQHRISSICMLTAHKPHHSLTTSAMHVKNWPPLQIFCKRLWPLMHTKL